jgi:hypothetical protein
VGTSAVGALLIFGGGPGWIAIVLIIAGFTAPVVYSLVYSKRLEREGEANGTA